MKNIARLAIMGLSFVAVASFADYPPQPPQGTSCKTLYNPSSDAAQWCGCYEQSSRDQCSDLNKAGLLPIKVNCDESPDLLALATKANEGGNISRFCNNQVNLLHIAGAKIGNPRDSAITVQNCEDDVGTIAPTVSGLSNMCTGKWPVK
jgi:hypothetical protein